MKFKQWTIAIDAGVVFCLGYVSRLPLGVGRFSQIEMEIPDICRRPTQITLLFIDSERLFCVRNCSFSFCLESEKSKHL